MRRDEIVEGKLVWFDTDDGGERVGFVTKITTRGLIKADIVWEKSGDSYTLKRTPIDKIRSYLKYKTERDEKLAISEYIGRVLSEKSNSTGAAIEAVGKFSHIYQQCKK